MKPKNLKPIFLVAFARGGSNLLLNLLRSHPELCSPRGETHQVFLGKPEESLAARAGKWFRYLPVLLAEKKHVFSPEDWRPRPPWSPWTQGWVDKILFEDKLRARGEGQNEFVAENIRYGEDQIRSSRLLCKNLNGLIFLSREFHRMYPDATFLALVRDARAVVEGHLRRGADLESFAGNYERGARRMIEDAASIPNYHLLRYEDLVAHPRTTLEKVYRLCGLDLGKVAKIRLETKAVLDEAGNHVFIRGSGRKRMLWYALDDFHQHLIAEANERQIRRLSESQRKRIEEICRESLRHFGYETSPLPSDALSS